MLIVRRSFTRPDSSIPWYSSVIEPDEGWLSRWIYYVEAEKVIQWDNETSDDALVMDYWAIWKDVESFYEYDHDELMNNYWAERDQYNIENGITMGDKIVEVFTDSGDTIEYTLSADWKISDLTP